MCPGTPNKLMKFCAEWVSCLCLLRKLILILSTFVTWAAGERSYTATTLQLRWVYTIYTAKTVTTSNSIQFLEHNEMFILYLISYSSQSIYCPSCQDIEEEAISIIDHSFKTLRSSAAAFNMLLKFKNIRSREAINSHLMGKFDDVLVRFCKEVLSCEWTKQDTSLYTLLWWLSP